MRKPFRPDLTEFLPRHAVLMARHADVDPGAASSATELESDSGTLTQRVSQNDGRPFDWPLVHVDGQPGGAGLIFAAEALRADPGAVLLLHKMIEAMGLRAADVQVVELGPPSAPQGGDRFSDLVTRARPLAVVLLGAERMPGTRRGQWAEFAGVRVMPTHSPGELLQSPQKKKETWADLQEVARAVGIVIPSRAPGRS